MRILVNQILGIVLGVVGHQAKPFIERDFQGGFVNIASYVLGCIMIIPPLMLNFSDLRELANDKMRFSIAYILSIFSIGAGVVLGYYLDEKIS